MNIRKSVGPNIEPWGTPDNISMKTGSQLPQSIACCLPLIYDLNQYNAEEENLYAESLFINIWWSTMSKAFLKSRKMEPTILPSSMLFVHSSTSLINVVWQECFCRNPDWLPWIIPYLFRYPTRCLLTCLSIILEIVRENWYRSIVGWICLGSALWIGNTLASFIRLGNWAQAILLLISVVMDGEITSAA